MRFSTIGLAALPLIVAATQQESPIDQFKNQAQYYANKFQSYIPNPSKSFTVDSAHAAAAKAGGKTLSILRLGDWRDIITSSVKPTRTTPEEWWVLVSGGNKTCFGHCGNVETAFNETAALFAANPTAPHLAYLNCENEPVLCNSWGVGPPTLWIMHVAAPPAPVDIHGVYLNATTTTVKTFTDLHSTESWKETPLYEGIFHPFNGPLAQYGLNVPLGYVLWVFAVVPSWLFMIGISFISRNIM
ncbi:hypothetical protein BJ878DRAFT_489383 [Calycina marina]|uniref:Peptidyl-tRNA hydrolase n=1 Tax=Calycina marina TaxID=1763456 RepID=A0A9P7ZA56_9HELO|nr:hypothetical protein BJ878DRAFT_489383 [Calycina marina]